MILWFIINEFKRYDVVLAITCICDLSHSYHFHCPVKNCPFIGYIKPLLEHVIIKEHHDIEVEFNICDSMEHKLESFLADLKIRRDNLTSSDDVGIDK